MKSSKLLVALATVPALGAGVSVARADSSEANCQVRKDGETKQGRSGPVRARSRNARATSTSTCATA
jgi:hypothetical protein